ncbi:MAG: glycosyltransferase [[Clostridium] fimetarium]|nr:glycosyltransferase [Alistipes timonensis]MCM1404867.1 glycosyltransferase [[Clostridium] fimetarium]
MKIDAVNLDMIFETSWEVCNKIGGIYTVLSTKALTLQNLYKDKTIFIGPDVWSEENPSPYFTEVPSILRPWRDKAELPEGISVRVGRWNIPGKPIVVLVKFDAMYKVKDYYYGEMWQRYGVDSLHAYGDYDEACAFSLAAGMVIESICNYKRTRHKSIVAHFDEWTTGMGLLYVNWKLPKVGTIFTTHATSIGRSICGNGKPLYDYMRGYNGDQMARELNMESKHSLEKAAAHNADCFTTVSDVTAAECEQLLDKRPDIVTPNGFQPDAALTRARMRKAREVAREAMLKVGSAMIGRELPADTFIAATSGRCEYRNKGIDVFLDAAKLIQQSAPSRQLLLFVMVPAWSKEPRQDVKDAVAAGNNPGVENPALTHWLNNPESDPIINRIHQLGFSADRDSAVQVIYVPCYLNGDDGIFNMQYYDMLAGMDATAFPSYYEPWGYTPLESVAYGVPTVTTSLSGFGQWILSTSASDFEQSGVVVIPRGDSNYGEVVEKLASSLRWLADADSDTRDKVSKASRATADKALWDYFIVYYVDAFKKAREAASARE